MRTSQIFKGVISYQSGKIPFVINEYKMELFSEMELIKEFIKEFNFKSNYILKGFSFDANNDASEITIIVEKSIAETCYLKCFYINFASCESDYDSINFESEALDDIFQFKYKYLDLTREGINLNAVQKKIITIPFTKDKIDYCLDYFIGYNEQMGISYEFGKHGKISISLKTGDIEECYQLVLLLKRYSDFLTCCCNTFFRKITLGKH